VSFCGVVPSAAFFNEGYMCTHVWLYLVFSIVNILFRRVRICCQVYVMCCFWGVDRRGYIFGNKRRKMFSHRIYFDIECINPTIWLRMPPAKAFEALAYRTPAWSTYSYVRDFQVMVCLRQILMMSWFDLRKSGKSNIPNP